MGVQDVFEAEVSFNVGGTCREMAVWTAVGFSGEAKAASCVRGGFRVTESAGVVMER